MRSSSPGGRWCTEKTDAHWGRGVLGGIGSGDERGSPWMADPEETLGSGVQACNDPLRGICCKARCRTAVGGSERYQRQSSKNTKKRNLS